MLGLSSDTGGHASIIITPMRIPSKYHQRIPVLSRSSAMRSLWYVIRLSLLDSQRKLKLSVYPEDTLKLLGTC